MSDTLDAVTIPREGWLRVAAQGRPVEVDRDYKVIRGYVVAQEGTFKTERGEFDKKSLLAVQTLMRKAGPKGLKSRFGHPGLSDDGIGSFLGRARSPWRDVMTKRVDGEDREIELIRADLHIADAAFESPGGNIGGYVMKLATEDSDALSSSLVLEYDEEYRLQKDGTLVKDDEGYPLPPLWRPTALHASDIVDTGDAVDGLLCVEALPDGLVRKATEMLDAAFAGKDRQFTHEHLAGFVNRYMAARFPGENPDAERIIAELGAECEGRLRRMAMEADATAAGVFDSTL